MPLLVEISTQHDLFLTGWTILIVLAQAGELTPSGRTHDMMLQNVVQLV